ncbi:hydantoinase B/oxoprolinase family protein [Microvirga sp. VF16]|uniref:hydantoinase B/oxoprolinase family protein n=1 Tax=Microvirga sp. VF16 TaxID=2807101 RepID=UPI001FEFC733|nr:hydantoinase B/oxoprolinase family protein [Microvirga sp. VF16]
MTDVVFITLLQNRLDNISQQMGWVMQRTARSPIFSDAHDFSCFIADVNGNLVSVADGLPIHTGGGGFAVEAVVKSVGGIACISPGDVFISSDPYEGGGNHLPDWTIVSPVFFDDMLIAFTCNRAHQSDIGGGAAGTYNSKATEIFHEGIRIPPIRIATQGNINEDLVKLLKLNSRCPALIEGDLRAMIGSTKIGAKRIIELAHEVGVDKLVKAFNSVLDHAEKRMRVAIATLQAGTYTGIDASDTDCFTETSVPVVARIEVKGEAIWVDLSESADQIRGFKNSSLANTYSAVYVAILSFLGCDVPRNAGAFRPINIITREGSVVHARFPAPLTSCTGYPATEIINAVWQALGQARPDLSCAGWGKASHGICSGVGKGGDTFVLYHMLAHAGTGAVRGRDGFPSLGTVVTLGGIQIPNVEAVESKYPVFVKRQEMRCDAAGAGEYRGGTGVHYEVMIEMDAEHSFRGEGDRTPSGFGAVGGATGDKANVTIIGIDGTAEQAPQYGVVNLPPIELHITSSAGGGWGNPYARPPERVLRDVEDEIVSTFAARCTYGVAIDGSTMEIDWAETARLRQQAAPMIGQIL